MIRVVLAALMVAATACGPVCRIACPKEKQTLVLVDANGAALTPKQVTTSGSTFICGEGETTCAANRLTFAWPEALPQGPQRLRVEATTGELFEGDVTADFTLRPSPGTCTCGDSSYADLTVKLSR